MARYDLIAVYLMASRRNGTLYLGVTSDLLNRGLEHREGRFPGFARKHGCKLLVWWEQQHDMASAIAREKTLKKWHREYKLNLIERENPQWRDLYEDLLLPRHLRKFDDPWHEEQQ
jgi:putative endonuclease